MKVIIAGSRNCTNKWTLQRAIDACGLEITEVVSGTCRGVDTMGEQWAQHNNVPIKRFPPDWEKSGKAAGPIRNKQMAEYADALILLWNPEKSRGSRSMYNEAKKLDLVICSVIIS